MVKSPLRSFGIACARSGSSHRIYDDVSEIFKKPPPFGFCFSKTKEKTTQKAIVVAMTNGSRKIEVSATGESDATNFMAGMCIR